MTRHRNIGRKACLGTTALTLALLGHIGAAAAGGGYSETSGGSASVYNQGSGETGSVSTGTATFSSPDVEYTSSISAGAFSNVDPHQVDALVVTDAISNVTAKVPATTEQHTTSRVTSFSKNGGVIVKGRSNSLTTVVIGGRTYLVADEVARAAARSTPYGSSAATDTDVTITTSADPNTYSVGAVTTNKANRTPQ